MQLDQKEAEALLAVLDYCLDDEREDYERAGAECKDDHIFLDLQTLKNALDRLDRPATRPVSTSATGRTGNGKTTQGKQPWIVLYCGTRDAGGKL